MYNLYCILFLKNVKTILTSLYHENLRASWNISASVSLMMSPSLNQVFTYKLIHVNEIMQDKKNDFLWHVKITSLILIRANANQDEFWGPYRNA